MFQPTLFAFKVSIKGLDTSKNSMQWVFLTAFTLTDGCILNKQGQILNIGDGKLKITTPL